jgi:thiol-disulfide isomerase/thioredoxin
MLQSDGRFGRENGLGVARRRFLGLLAGGVLAGTALPASAAGAKPGGMCLKLASQARGIIPFELPVLGSSSETFRSSDIEGTGVWINFFASWCGDCVVEMADLLALESKYRSAGLTVIGIDTDEAPDRGLGFRDRYKIPYRLLSDASGTVFSQYVGTGHLPTHLFYNADRLLTCVGIEGFTRSDMENEIRVTLGL